jgi:hypothetical protein
MLNINAVSTQNFIAILFLLFHILPEKRSIIISFIVCNKNHLTCKPNNLILTSMLIDNVNHDYEASFNFLFYCILHTTHYMIGFFLHVNVSIV